MIDTFADGKPKDCRCCYYYEKKSGCLLPNWKRLSFRQMYRLILRFQQRPETPLVIWIITRERAMELFEWDAPVYLLYGDNTEAMAFTESALEMLSKMSDEEFEKLELGTGFAFIGRQVRFTFDEEHFMVDLVFYNRVEFSLETTIVLS